MTKRTALGVLAAAVVLLTAGCAGENSPGTLVAATWQPPSSYEYTVDSTCGEQLLTGRLTLTVKDGKVTDAVGIDLSGQNTVASAELANLPTLMDLLDEYEAAKRRNVHVAKVELDPADGHPTRIDIDTDRSAIDDEICYVISNYWARP